MYDKRHILYDFMSFARPLRSLLNIYETIFTKPMKDESCNEVSKKNGENQIQQTQVTLCPRKSTFLSQTFSLRLNRETCRLVRNHCHIPIRCFMLLNACECWCATSFSTTSKSALKINTKNSHHV